MFLTASRSLPLIALLCIAPPVVPAQPTPLPFTAAIDSVLTHSSPVHGTTPFHAVLTITGPTPAYAGTVELSWLAPRQYRLVLDSPAFHQLRIVNGDQVQEENRGDFYPRWLQDFANSLLDPIPIAANFNNVKGTLRPGPAKEQLCLRRDDRPGGITDQLTWAILCLSADLTRVQSVLSMNHILNYADWRPFGSQSVPRTVTTGISDSGSISGHLTTLEPLAHPDPSLVAITTPTPPAQLLQTEFVSTADEESMIDHPPAFTWPTVREGKTDGFIILYARTDRTGRVRETARHSSDNPGLEGFGEQQALTLRFHPPIVDGVPQQMEMPLVLHFHTTLADPIPVLDDAAMRHQITGCTLPEAKDGVPVARVESSVDQTGQLMGLRLAEGPQDKQLALKLFKLVSACTFAPLLRDGKLTYYHGILTLPR